MEWRGVCADLEGGCPEFAKLNIADITSNEKVVIFNICTSTVIRPQNNNQITSIQDFLCLCNGFFLT